MTKYVPLTQRKVAIVDDDDYEYLMQWKWYYNKGYACRSFGSDTIFMHRQLMFRDDLYNKLDVDHENHNTLDNQKHNMRKCTRAQNMWNRDKFKNNKSGYKGIYWNKSSNTWIAELKENNNRHYLGSFSDINNAIKARRDAEMLYHKEFRKE